MGAIAFSKRTDESWIAAGWAFRQVLDDTISNSREDTEMFEAFAEAKAIDGLMIHMLPPQLASRVTASIRQVVTSILSGSTRSRIYDTPYGNAKTVDEYYDALRTLFKALPSPEGGKST